GSASVDSIVAVAKMGKEVSAAKGAVQLILKQRFDYLVMGIRLEAGPSVEVKDLSQPMVDAINRKDFDEFNRLANYVNAQRLWCNGLELGIDVNELVKMAKLMDNEVKPAKCAADQFSPIEKIQKILDDALNKSKSPSAAI